MAWVKAGKPACVLTVIFTIIAVMAGFFVSAIEPARAACFAYTRTESGGGKLGGCTASPVNGPALLTKTSVSGLTPLRTGYQRIFSPCGTHGAVFVFSRSCLETILSIDYAVVKKPILPKLRI
ncbi:MAG: hypothetical protein LBP37_04440 [Spirochaetaceae bacterium]|jgi:hypothetical protein|nr:hypothetical protein [Spirochaetaceae bacterium]